MKINKQIKLILLLNFLFSLTVKGEVKNSPNESLPAIASATPSNSMDSNKSPILKWNGDFRYRFQREIDGDDAEHLMNKLRLRLGLGVEIDSNTALFLKLTSYSKPESSAASGNFNMGDNTGAGFQRRMIGIDHAYVSLRPTDFMQIHLGKVPMNLIYAGKSQLILDSDLGLEGLSIYNQWTLNDEFSAYFNFGYFVFSENYGTTPPKSDETDNTIYTPQFGLKFHQEDWTFQGMISKATFIGLKGDSFAHTCCGVGVIAKARGNSEGIIPGTYLNDYDLTEVGFEAKTRMDSFEFSLFLQNIVNTSLSKNNNAHWIGFTLANGPVSLFYAQSKVESDSLVAAMTDADLAKGETDSLGQQITIQYKVKPSWVLSLTRYDSEYKRTLNSNRYQRLGIDSQWNF